MYYIKRLVVLAVLAFVVFSSPSTADEDEKVKADGDSPTGSDESGNGTTQVTEEVWSYENNDTNPSMWPKLGFPQCGGDQQSPISIDTATVERNEHQNPKLINFKHYQDEAKTVTVKNNGHTLVVTFDYGPVSWRPSVSGAGLKGTYEFVQLHFHWGNMDINTHQGAEHIIDGVPSPLEMHMVHRNVKYKTMGEAVNKKDGILVLASIFEMESNVKMPFLASLDGVAELILTFNGTATLAPRPLASVLPDDTNSFFHYRGSLTTPGCQESVDWIVFEESAHVIRKQLEMLYKIQRGDGETNLYNFRPTQKLNGRKISHMVYKKPDKKQVIKSSAPQLQTMSGLYVILFAMTASCKLYLQ